MYKVKYLGLDRDTPRLRAPSLPQKFQIEKMPMEKLKRIAETAL